MSYIKKAPEIRHVFIAVGMVCFFVLGKTPGVSQGQEFVPGTSQGRRAAGIIYVFH